MSVFVIFRVHDPQRMEAELDKLPPGKYLRLREGMYLASASGTAKALADTLGVSDGDTGPAIIFKMESYFGRASLDIWDWIKTEAEQSVG
jgi:hypothetical protein